MTPDMDLRAEAIGFAVSSGRTFHADGDGRYILALQDAGIYFDLDRVRRERHELIGELTVRCDLPGSQTVGVDATLSSADFNLSSVRARQDRARLLAQRSRAPELDWLGLVEDFCQRVIAAERAGHPAVHLHEVDPPRVDRGLEVDGWRLPAGQPTILFGDGGGLKSYLALHAAGRFAQNGLRVLFADWELDPAEHRDRLQRLFGLAMPDVLYARCDRPLVAEADRLGRIVRESRVGYTMFDSIAFACDGPPESAEVAAAYFRAVRAIGGGSLHLAHVSKSEGSDQKPFGSAFWHNGARSTWFAQRSEESSDGKQITLGLFNRKSNLGPQLPALGLEFTFDPDRTFVRRVDVASVQDLASRAPLWQRMIGVLRGGPKTLATMADELDGKVDTIDRYVRRHDRLFTRVPGPDGVTRIALVDRRSA